jgi:hypothetical protein
MAEHMNGETGEVIVMTYRRSTEIHELFTALAKAQGVFSGAEKAATGNFGKYATLDSVLEATKQGREQNSLALIQFPSNGDGNSVTVTTLLGHSSGQWLESTLSCAPTKFDAQGVGSVVTYLRKYSAMAILGVAPEDDDGAAASIQQPATKGATRTAAPRPTPAAMPPAASAEGSPSPSDTSPAWVSKFLTRGTYEIDPNVKGGWSAWEKFYCDVANGADNLDQLLKLDDDNKEHIEAFAKAHVKEVYNNFCDRVKANAKRLAEFVAPTDTDALLRRMRRGEPV